MKHTYFFIFYQYIAIWLMVSFMKVYRVAVPTVPASLDACTSENECQVHRLNTQKSLFCCTIGSKISVPRSWLADCSEYAHLFAARLITARRAVYKFRLMWVGHLAPEAHLSSPGGEEGEGRNTAAGVGRGTCQGRSGMVGPVDRPTGRPAWRLDLPLSAHQGWCCLLTS